MLWLQAAKMHMSKTAGSRLLSMSGGVLSLSIVITPVQQSSLVRCFIRFQFNSAIDAVLSK